MPLSWLHLTTRDPPADGRMRGWRRYWRRYWRRCWRSYFRRYRRSYRRRVVWWRGVGWYGFVVFVRQAKPLRFGNERRVQDGASAGAACRSAFLRLAINGARMRPPTGRRRPAGARWWRSKLKAGPSTSSTTSIRSPSPRHVNQSSRSGEPPRQARRPVLGRGDHRRRSREPSLEALVDRNG